MRKRLAWIFGVAFSILFLSVASADLPSVTLAITEDAVNGGLPVSVVLTADAPMPRDTEIVFADSDDNPYAATILTGQAEASLSVDTPVVDRCTAFTLALADGNGYQAAGDDQATLYPLPKIEFYEEIYVRHINRETALAVTMPKNNLLEDGVFELRDQNGDILSTLTISKNTGRTLHNFEWMPDDRQEGRHDLSVWWNGFEVSTGTGYLAMADGKHQSVHNYDVSEKFIALSLDCAYQWDYVDDFLEMLDRQGVKVTFFMTGFGVKAQPDAVLKIAAHGHELGNHSYNHGHMTEIDNMHVVRREIRSTNNLIEEITGIRPVLFRPPYGEYDQFVSAISRAEGCEVIMWTNDAKDWMENATVNSIYHNIIRNEAPGNIILAHILNKDTVEAMDMAITHFKELGYRLGTVSKLAAICEEEHGKDNEP